MSADDYHLLISTQLRLLPDEHVLSFGQNSNRKTGWISQFVCLSSGCSTACSESNMINPVTRTCKTPPFIGSTKLFSLAPSNASLRETRTRGVYSAVCETASRFLSVLKTAVFPPPAGAVRFNVGSSTNTICTSVFCGSLTPVKPQLHDSPLRPK